MRAHRLTMRTTREILRLRLGLALPIRHVARSCHITPSTVHGCLARAEEAGLTWPLPSDLDDAALEARLYPGLPGPVTRAAPDFPALIGHEVHVLEVGIYRGGSIEMWRHYFGPNCRVYGVDLEEACKVYEDNGTKVFIGDQEDRDSWKHFKADIPLIDIIVDDGGHRPEQQIVTLEGDVAPSSSRRTLSLRGRA